MVTGSQIFLSLSTIFAVLGLAAVIIAGITTNWVEWSVNRREIINAFTREPELNIKLKESFIRDPLYFSRNYGLFHTCFSDAVPTEIGSFTWIFSPCILNNDYTPSQSEISTMSAPKTERMWFLRATALLYALGVVFALFSLIIGVCACWRTSTRCMLTTGAIMLLAVVFLGASLITWHRVQLLEKETLDEAPFYKSWEPILKSTSRFQYGLSYFAMWIGTGFMGVGAICMFVSGCTLKSEEEKAYEAKHDPYMMPSYYDKGTMSMMPYYSTYTAGYAYPPQQQAQYGNYGAYPNAYYGYMTYGR